MNDTKFTNGPQVELFEREFAAWLGVEYAVMVNSGSSANELSLQAAAILRGVQEVVVPVLTWVSDIAAILHAGLTPLFADIDPRTLGIDWNRAPEPRSHAIYFPTHCLGFSALTNGGPIPNAIIEDCCEALGATHEGRKLGSIGWLSNFSFYYAHHMTTMEGGMICTNDPIVYDLLRSLRSHGLVREMKNPNTRAKWACEYIDLDPNFIFTHPAHNYRPVEISAVIGRNQLPRADANNAQRTANLLRFLQQLDSRKYRTEYRTEGSSNYALPLVLHEPDSALMARVLALLTELGVEYRKGTAGGGNQLRQPYARARWGELYKEFPQAEHVHHFGLYIGNYPGIEPDRISALCDALNAL